MTVFQPTGEGPSDLLTSTLATVISILETPSGGALVTRISNVAWPDCGCVSLEDVDSTSFLGSEVGTSGEVASEVPPQAAIRKIRAIMPTVKIFVLSPLSYMDKRLSCFPPRWVIRGKHP